MAIVHTQVQVAPDGTGKKVRNVKKVIATEERHSQVIALGDPDDASSDDAIAKVVATTPAAGDYGLVTRPIGPLTDTQLRATPVPVSGTVATGGLTDAQLRATAVPVSGTVAVTGPLTDAQLRAAAVPTKETRAAASAVTSVASSATSVTLLASNANRLGATVHNDSTAALFLKLGATASSSSFTVKMAADSYYEVPFGYTGILGGIWASANGSARVTEVTA